MLRHYLCIKKTYSVIKKKRDDKDEIFSYYLDKPKTDYGNYYYVHYNIILL